MYSVKRQETTEFHIGEYTFYVRKFAAFYAANVSAELTKTVAPIIGGIAPLMGGMGERFSLADVNMDYAGAALQTAFSQLTGEEFERVISKLLINDRNVSVSGPATEGSVRIMSKDDANEIFCGEVENMILLCVKVIELNYKGFFKKVAARFGNLSVNTEAAESKTTESLT